MSKEIIIGVDSVRYKDKESGAMIDAVNLHTVSKNLKTIGYATNTIWIDAGRLAQAYEMFMNYCECDNRKLCGLLIDVSRGNRGYLENIEIIKPVPDSVLIEFP